MKILFYAVLLFLAGTIFSQAATRGDVKVIEASENIRYLSQKIVKDYLFLYKYPEQIEVKNKLNRELQLLSNDLRVIATTTKDSDTKDILEFLAYSKDQISEIFDQKIDEEKVALMLDYSETLLEGADSIALAHKYEFSDEEKMLMTMKKIAYLLERVTKYYMALNIGFNTTTNKEQIQNAMTEIEESLYIVSQYSYPNEIQGTQHDINYAWQANRIFFDRSETLFIPKLIFISVSYLEDTVAKLELFHSKNQ